MYVAVSTDNDGKPLYAEMKVVETYWVRLAGQILVHSVPRDNRWRTKKEEHAELGLPASHGCIRLDEKDAEWFYENIPRGTLVIIHH